MKNGFGRRTKKKSKIFPRCSSSSLFFFYIFPAVFLSGGVFHCFLLITISFLSSGIFSLLFDILIIGSYKYFFLVSLSFTGVY